MATMVKEDARVARMAQLEELFRGDPNLLEDYFDEEIAHQDYAIALRDSRAEGHAEGREEGREEGRAEGWEEALLATARRMKMSGLPDVQIAEFTGLPLGEIEGL